VNELSPSPYFVASRAVAHLRNRTCGTRALAEVCKATAQLVDDALVPLVDAGKLMRINAFRNGAPEFDYRYSATWVPNDADLALCIGGGTAPVAAISAVAPATPTRLAPAAPPQPVPAHVARPAMTAEERVKQGRRGAATKNDRAALERSLAQSPQSLGWALAPPPAPEPEAEAQSIVTQQENVMSKPARKPRTTNGASPRFQICALLMAKGDLSRDELAAGVSAKDKQLYNAIYQAKGAGHIVFIEKTGKFHVTAQGKDWTSGGANLDNQRATTSSPSEVKRGRRQAREKSTGLPKQEKNRLGVVDVRGDGSVIKTAVDRAASPIEVASPHAFRCGVFSDGGFHVTKKGVSIDLDKVELAQMLRYLERMAEETV
jgi:hypothetical protein